MNDLQKFIERSRVIRDNNGLALGALAPIGDLWVACDKNTKFEVFLDRQTARDHLTSTITIN